MINAAVKRLFDIIGSFTALIVFSPVMMWASFKIRSGMAPPALFTQMRAGKDGKRFKLYKFRTMTNERDHEGNLLPDEDRITEFGTRLRSSSIDELPQLLNVLKGEMSLVGPRPLLLEYVPLYNDAERKRLSVKPGITGWAQVNGRNAISWQEKFALDVWYVENGNFFLDMKIIALTIRQVFKKDGISAEGEATMPKFTGSEAK